MENKTLETLYIVSPCYNEEETLPKSVPVFMQKLDALIADNKVSAQSRLLLVDDGSFDRTWETVRQLQTVYPEKIEAVRLKENSGEIRAYLAGLKAAEKKADVIVTIDCDLQDDIDAIDEMLRLHQDGAHIVHGCRPVRSTDSPLYRLCANGFYFLMRSFGSKIAPHSSEYRLLSKDAVNALMKADKKTPFLPAEIPLIDLPSARVYYERRERVAGKSNYNYCSLLKLAATALWGYTFFFEAAAAGCAACAALIAVKSIHKK